MPKGVSYQIIGGPEFKRVAMRLREIDKTMPGQFRRALIASAKPMARDAQSRVRRIPVKGTEGHTGLRSRVAAGVHVQASPSASNPYVRITTSMPERDEAVIPRGLDRQRGWRHPVYGNRNVWVTQRTGGSWFRVAMQNGHDATQRRLTEVLEDAADRVADAGS